MTDIDFEELAADLLTAELNTHVERFGRGADGGVDLRWQLEPNLYGIAQCKHYLDSTVSQLMASAKREAPKVARVKPERYIFATSRELTARQKDQIYDLFVPWMKTPSDVFSGSDLDQLLDKHETVDRKHIKMWLATGTHLFWAAHPEIASRSEALRERIDRTISNYVGMSAYGRANEILDAEKVCLIAGQPGIGKTVLAHVLIANHLARGFEVVEVSGDVDEAWIALDPARPQIFFYDDFLGQLAFSERLGKNEDSRLSDFVNKIREQKSSRLILTTREYILRDALRAYSRLDHVSQRGKYILELKDYSRNDRARILYNHAWRAGLEADALGRLAGGGWKRIIDHPNFSPRLVEYGTRLSSESRRGSWLDAFEYALDHPSTLWRRTFETHLTEADRALLFVLASFGLPTELDAVRSAYRSLLGRLGLPFSSTALRRSLETLEGTFIAVNRDHRGSVVGFHNPSIVDFVLGEIKNDAEMQRDLVGSATHFEQLERLWVAKSSSITVSDKAGTSALRSEVLDPSVSSEFSAAIGGMFEAEPLAARASYYGSAAESLEERFLFVIDLPSEWRPDEAWRKAQASKIVKLWEGFRGNKACALDIVFGAKAGAKSSFPPNAIEVLANWICGDLSETEDWEILGNYLKDCGDVSAGRAYSEQFFDHVQSELEQWDPCPPDLPALRSLSDFFGTFELDEYFDEAEVRESRSDEAASENTRGADRMQSADQGDDDAVIEEYFDRFSTVDRV